jgi:hypothetical protein
MPHPRDAWDRASDVPPVASWPKLFKAIFLTFCVIIVALDHAWAKAGELKHLMEEISEGRLSPSSWLALATIAATIALCVVLVKDGRELLRELKKEGSTLKALIK